MFTKEFWKTVGERALVAAGAVVLANLTDGNLATFDWKETAITAGYMALLSVLAAFLPAGGRGNPTLALPPNLPVVRRDTAQR